MSSVVLLGISRIWICWKVYRTPILDTIRGRIQVSGVVRDGSLCDNGWRLSAIDYCLEGLVLILCRSPGSASGVDSVLWYCVGWGYLCWWLAACSRWLLSRGSLSYVVRGSWIRLYLLCHFIFIVLLLIT